MVLKYIQLTASVSKKSGTIKKYMISAKGIHGGIFPYDFLDNTQ